MRQPSEHRFESWDGTRLFYRAWIPANGATRAMLLFHRGHEHSGRWQDIIDSLGLGDVAIFAWDARGHGLSPGERGSATSLNELVKDVDAFVRHVSASYGIAPAEMILLAHSLAAVVVAAWVHDYALPIRALILATSAFEVKLYVPLAIPALRLLRPKFVKSYVRSSLLTHDAVEAKRYNDDPLIFRQVSVNLLLDLHDAGRRLVRDAAAIRVPVLLLAAGRDHVVTVSAQRRFFDGLSSETKCWQLFPNAYHSIFHECERADVCDVVGSFVRQQFDTVPGDTSVLGLNGSSYTWKEYERLQNGSTVLFAAAKFALRAAGYLSRGIALGWRSGFDSGLSLDYVYENIPRGATPIGRLIDRSYLNSPGWRGIRQRKTNLEAMLRRLIATVRATGGTVTILDVAAGAGRYVLETMAQCREVPVAAHLRDYRGENIEAARALATKLNLSNVTLEQGDAFDRNSLGSIRPRVAIAVVSGLYELFPSNEHVVESLHGIADAMLPGGYLVYTNQPWHPQLEFIARVLRNREGKPWIMRRRTTAEIDALVRSAGFEKIEMEIDQWGMFSVSVARKVAPDQASLP